MTKTTINRYFTSNWNAISFEKLSLSEFIRKLVPPTEWVLNHCVIEIQDKTLQFGSVNVKFKELKEMYEALASVQ